MDEVITDCQVGFPKFLPPIRAVWRAGILEVLLRCSRLVRTRSFSPDKSRTAAERQRLSLRAPCPRLFSQAGVAFTLTHKTREHKQEPQPPTG